MEEVKQTSPRLSHSIWDCKPQVVCISQRRRQTFT